MKESARKGQVKWLVIGGILAILIIGLVVIVGNNYSPSEPQQSATTSSGKIKVGVMIPLTGDAASYGEGVKKGIELAAQDAGLDNVELIFEDSKCEGKEAATVINKLITIDKVTAIIGELCSGATLAAAPIAERNKIPLISPASTSPAITTAGEYIFRTIPSDALQGNFGAQLVAEKGYTTLAILYSNEEYGLGFNKVLKEKFSGEVVASETFDRGATDLRTQLTKIKAAEPNALYIISNSPDAAVAALKQAKELGLEVALFGSEGLKSPDTLEAGNAAEGLILTSVSSGTSGFIEKHKQVYNAEPGPFAAQAYDAFMVLAEVLQAGATTGEAIKDALYEVSFNGASGTIAFDQYGDVAGNYDVYEVKDGEFVLVP